MTSTSRLGTSPAFGIKKPCVAATTANITLSGVQTIDTVLLTAGDRVLVKDQTDATENGIYVCGSGVWERATDFNDQNDVVSGTMVLDENQSTVYYCSFTGDYEAGTSSVSWAEASSAFAQQQADAAAASAAAAATSASNAATSETNAANSASAAATSATNAANSVQDIPSPSGGVSGDVLQRNSAGDGFELTDTRTTNLANSVVRRDAGGRAQFADPSSNQDAATKLWTETEITNRKAVSQKDETDDNNWMHPKGTQDAIASRALPTSVNINTTSLTTITGNWQYISTRIYITSLSSNVSIRDLDGVYVRFVTGAGAPSDGWFDVDALTAGGDSVSQFYIGPLTPGSGSGTIEIYVPANNVSDNGFAHQVFCNQAGTQVKVNTSDDIDGTTIARTQDAMLGVGYDATNGIVFGVHEAGSLQNDIISIYKSDGAASTATKMAIVSI